MNPQKQSFLLMKKYFGTKGIFIQQQKNIYLIPIKLYVYLLAIIDFLCYINTSLNMEDKNAHDQTDRALTHQPNQIENHTEAQLLFGFEITTSSIADLFEEVALMLGYQMIEKELNHATAIKQYKKNFWQYLDCFNWVTEGNTTAIKMTINTSEKNSTRVCRLRGLIGSKKQVKLFLTTFKQRSEILIKQHPAYFEQSQQILDEPENPYHLQACAAYMFHKILSNEHYGIGNRVAQSLKDYSNSFSDVEKSIKVLPLPMKTAMTIIREVVDNLYKDFNLARKEMEKIMPYCRISVEKYIFDKIQKIIVPIYSQKNSLQNTIFQEKRTKILSQKKLKETFSEINLEKHIWMFEKLAESKINEYLDSIMTRQELRSISKYRKVCEQFQKMTHVSNPRQKMKHCQIAYSVLKALVYESSNKKNELTNMQDIIPIFIFIIMLCDIPEIKSQFDMIADFIEFDNCDLESQRRLLLNLSESFNFICRDWKI